MATLSTVSQYIDQARILLQDSISPYRYPDADLLLCLNDAMLETRRLRPDLFLSAEFTLPSFSANDSTAVGIDEQYRMAILYYIVGMAQLRDDEATDDARAAGFIAKYKVSMLGLEA